MEFPIFTAAGEWERKPAAVTRRMVKLTLFHCLYSEKKIIIISRKTPIIQLFSLHYIFKKIQPNLY